MTELRHSDPQRGQRFGFLREILLILGIDSAVALFTPDIEALAHANEPDIPLQPGMNTQGRWNQDPPQFVGAALDSRGQYLEIGRASCRERV